LITGVCGFVGSSLAIELANTLPQIELVGIDNLSRPGSERNRQAIKGNGVFHCAARPSHDLAKARPLEDFDINARATLCLLETARSATARNLRSFHEHQQGLRR